MKDKECLQIWFIWLRQQFIGDTVMFILLCTQSLRKGQSFKALYHSFKASYRNTFFRDLMIHQNELKPIYWNVTLPWKQDIVIRNQTAKMNRGIYKRHKKISLCLLAAGYAIPSVHWWAEGGLSSCRELMRSLAWDKAELHETSRWVGHTNHTLL